MLFRSKSWDTNTWIHVAPGFPKKHCLGPQNDSGISQPKNMLKLVNYATIKETEKLKEKKMGPQVEYAGGEKYPPGSFLPS